VCYACEKEAERHAKALLAEAEAMDADTTTEPYLIETQAEIDGYPPFPFPKVGEYDTSGGPGNYPLADGWEVVRELFCDSSGLGQPGESALTIEQLKAELRPGFAYGITGEGQFQVRVTEFRKLPSRLATGVDDGSGVR
jgi:hypothetical protein